MGRAGGLLVDGTAEGNPDSRGLARVDDLLELGLARHYVHAHVPRVKRIPEEGTNTAGDEHNIEGVKDALQLRINRYG